MRFSTHGKALSGSIQGQGSGPFANRVSRSAMVRSARCRPARNEFAYYCYLELFADKILRSYEQLSAAREAKLAVYHKEHRKWRKTCDALGEGARVPREPIYEGPTEWELRYASDKVKAIQ